MKKIKLYSGDILCCIFLLMAVTSGDAHSQSKVMSARSAGLRGANAAEFGDVESFHQNPASLAFLKRAALSLSHMQGSTGRKIDEIVDVPILSDHGIGIAASLGLSHYGYLPSASQQMLGYTGEVAVGYEAWEHFGVGALVTLEHATSNGSIGSGVFTSFGLLYAPASEMSYTITFGGIGTEPSYAFASDSLSLDSGRRPRSLQIAVAMRFPSPVSSRKQVLGLSISNEKIIGEDGLIYRGGIEVLPSGFLSLRLGYEAGPETSGYACGIGLAFGVVRVDYALSKAEQSFLHCATVACEL